ncbi:MAG: T9SS type A sorting domain-containing protein, partial [Bacteroidota bacterium]
QDNCPGMRSLQSINGQLNNCGVGQFIRFFRVVDASGQLANNECRQVINVTPHHEYSIRFPGDERYLCGELPDPEDIVGEESGCDLLSVTTDVDTLTVTDVGDCYKLRLTHEVINWCEYDDISPAIQVPRDPDNDGNFEEPVFLNIAGISTATLDDDRAILDQDATPFNGNDLRTLLPNFGTDRRRGHYRYRQFVRVYDDIDPTLTVPLPDLGLAFTEDCRGGVILEFTATDNCSGATTTRIFLDQDAVDRNNDGNLTGVDFVSDREIAPSRFVGDPATGVEVFIRNLPIGQHLARVITFDGCGNQDQRYVVLTVEDSKAPTPACIQSLSTALMPDPDFGGIGVVWANDYVASPAVVCTETEITYAIYRETEAREAGFIPDPTHDRLDVDCSDVGELPVRIYAFAASNGRYDFCNATLHVSANNGDVCADRNANIAGLIRTETGLPMGDVTVYNDGPTSLQDVTTEDGTFLFDGLQELQDYTIQPYDNRDAINGVTTRDITIVARYLLGVDDKLSPYQLIAADANRNREITVRDLLMIREVILGIKDNFDNNTSWRFLPSSYTFPDPEDPFLEVFPEVGNFNDLSGNNFVEFVGLKVGDLDNSAGVFEGLPPEDGNGLAGPTTDLYLRPVAGQPQAWELFAGQEVAGMQFSLDLPAKTRVLPGQITTEEYRLVGNGRLHVSHVATSRSFGHALLRFEVPKEALPRLVQEDTDQRFLTAEAYDKTMATFGLRLRVTEAEAIVSASVFPNPVVETATLSLSWPVAEAITLTVQDLAGRVVVRRELSLLAGNNTVPLRATELRDGAGVYLLSLRGAQHDTALRVVRQ